MSLIRFAVRQCAARAIAGATLAEGRVFMSVIDPISAKLTEERAPVITVNTDDHKQAGDGRDLTGGEAHLDLVFEAAIAARVQTVGTDGSGAEVAVTIIEADAGLDLTLDLIEHQIVRALLGPSPWADLFRCFAPVIHERHSRRGADASGTRWAARQLVIRCDTLAEPVGAEDIAPGTVWGDFIASMDADASLAPIAPLIRATLAGDARDWVRGAAMMGLSPDQMADIGPGPLVLDDGGQPIALDGFDLEEDRAE